MRKVLTAIGNPMLNNKIKKLKNYEILADDISTDDDLIETLEREENVEILFLHPNIMSDFSMNELIGFIRKIHENIFIVLFNENNENKEIEENDKLKLCPKLDFDWELFEKDFPQENVPQLQENTSQIIAISGASGIRKKHIFHISCKKCGK